MLTGLMDMDMSYTFMFMSLFVPRVGENQAVLLEAVQYNKIKFTSILFHFISIQFNSIQFKGAQTYIHTSLHTQLTTLHIYKFPSPITSHHITSHPPTYPLTHPSLHLPIPLQLSTVSRLLIHPIHPSFRVNVRIYIAPSESKGKLCGSLFIFSSSFSSFFFFYTL